MAKARKRFNHTGVLVASSNIVRASLAKRFDIICRYNEDSLGRVTHSTLTFNLK